MRRATHCAVASLLTAAALAHGNHAHPTTTAPIPVKLLLVSMSFVEAFVWLPSMGNTTAITVPGLSRAFPDAWCNASAVCLVVTGMGHSNAAVSMTALLFSRDLFDFSSTFIMIAGIAGVDPARGTLGSVAWSRYVGDFGLQMEVDGRATPANWSGGMWAIDGRSPLDKPSTLYGTELYQLNETLLQAALTLSAHVSLADAPGAQAYRALYPGPPASAPPAVVQCDSLTGDTWFGGHVLGQRARDWMGLLTDGKGVYCVAQQEDSASLEAITRADAAGLASLQRVLVLRAGSDFDRPPPGGDDVAALMNYADQGGLLIALENLYAAGAPVVRGMLSGEMEVLMGGGGRG